ncbi:MAG: hypothetical protein ACJ8DI_25795 [Ktedonobacteraceae bacterium]
MTTTIDILNVTQEQIDRCHRILHENTGETFYQVESESDPTKEYEVHFIKGRGFTCTCPAGASGFHHCSKGTCKHCRWAVAHAVQFRQEQAKQSEINHLIDQGCDFDTAARILAANEHPFQYSELEVKRAQQANQARPFSILR